MWEKRISHEGLHTYRVVRGVSKEEAELKARLQLLAWQDRWSRLQAVEAKRRERLSRRAGWERQAEIEKRARDVALELTREAEAEMPPSRLGCTKRYDVVHEGPANQAHSPAFASGTVAPNWLAVSLYLPCEMA
jgi:hypothetical protein